MEKPIRKGSLTGSKLWIMRLIAATVVPLLMLGGLELLLRIGGYGYSTTYFKESQMGGEKYLIPNHTFTYRFFPKDLSRAPLATRVAKKKPPATYRVFLFGESAAYGDPDPAYGIGRHLEVLLSERYPGTNFEVICTAMTAINSHAILPIARECAELDGDLWIIYMGNNEMVGAYGAGTAFSSRAPSLSVVRGLLALKATRSGQLLTAMLESTRKDSEPPENWDGINMFSKNLRHDDPGRLTAYNNFRGNLEDILKVAGRSDIPVVLSTVASNLKDCAPFSSVRSEGLNADQIGRWKEHFSKGLSHEASGQYIDAVNAYSKASSIDSGYADLQFRLGRCLMQIGEVERAKQAFAMARDFDGLAVRADSRINGILREVAQKNASEDLVFFDAEQIFSNASEMGVSGRDQFFEHVHFTLSGNYLLSRSLAEKIVTILPDDITLAGSEGWVSEPICRRKLAATLWDQHRLWNNILLRISVPPHTSQLNHEENSRYCEERKKEVISRITRNTPQEDRRLYETALASRPDDNIMIERFAQYLEAMGSRKDAIQQFEKLCRLLPDLEWPYYYLGELWVREGNKQKAAEAFQRALDVRGDFIQARDALNALDM
jgi:tetratricopeptide (TPR) repeat protein